MKNICYKLILLSLILSFTACTVNSENRNQNISKSKNNINESIIDVSEPENYSATGKIIRIGDKCVYIKNSEETKVYAVDNELTDSFFVGEYVNLNQVESNKYNIVSNLHHDYKNRYTIEGTPVKRITGMVGDVSENTVEIITEMGNINVRYEGEFKLKNKAQGMFDYAEIQNDNSLISYFDESSKIHADVKEISKDINGSMRIYAVANDTREFDIQLNADTITDFAPSLLNVGEKIVVYPEKITDNVPAFVNAKLIIKDEKSQ